MHIVNENTSITYHRLMSISRYTSQKSKIIYTTQSRAGLNVYINLWPFDLLLLPPVCSFSNHLNWENVRRGKIMAIYVSNRLIFLIRRRHNLLIRRLTQRRTVVSRSRLWKKKDAFLIRFQNFNSIFHQLFCEITRSCCIRHLVSLITLFVKNYEHLFLVLVWMLKRHPSVDEPQTLLCVSDYSFNIRLKITYNYKSELSMRNETRGVVT